MSVRHRPQREGEGPEQLPLTPAPAPKPRLAATAPERAAKAYIARRTKPSVVPGRVKVTFTLDIPRALAERLSARAIREGKNLEAVVIEILGEAGTT
jgi:hypothetical protein